MVECAQVVLRLRQYEEAPVTTAVKSWRRASEKETCLCPEVQYCGGASYWERRVYFRGFAPSLLNVLGSLGSAVVGADTDYHACRIWSSVKRAGSERRIHMQS